MNVERKIDVIVVLYYPDSDKVCDVVRKLLNEGARVIIIENTPNFFNEKIVKCFGGRKGFIYLALGKNMGIAFAQNIGIDISVSYSDTDYIIFLDQDSYIDNGFLDEMYSEYLKISNIEEKVGLVSPTLASENFCFEYKQNEIKKHCGYSIVDKTSSSGSMISKSVISDVGGMEEKLFIDLVDSEWCWRSREKGYICCVTKKINMKHQIGERHYKILGLGIIVSSPNRYYYKYKNFIKMLNRSYVPFQWKIKTFLKYIIFVFIVPIIDEKGFECVRYMYEGAKDGIFEVMN